MPHIFLPNIKPHIYINIGTDAPDRKPDSFVFSVYRPKKPYLERISMTRKKFCGGPTLRKECRFYYFLNLLNYYYFKER